MTKFEMFLSDDAGAVTVDWVALTAGVLFLGVVVAYAIFNDGVSGLVSKINSSLNTVSTDINLASIDAISSGSGGS